MDEPKTGPLGSYNPTPLPPKARITFRAWEKGDPSPTNGVLELPVSFTCQRVPGGPLVLAQGAVGKAIAEVRIMVDQHRGPNEVPSLAPEVMRVRVCAYCLGLVQGTALRLTGEHA